MNPSGLICGIWYRAAETGHRGVQETDTGTAGTFWETKRHSGQTHPPPTQTTRVKGEWHRLRGHSHHECKFLSFKTANVSTVYFNLHAAVTYANRFWLTVISLLL